MRAANFERVEQSYDVGDQGLEFVSARRGIRSAVTALVVTQDAELVLKRRGLVVPHRHAGHERVGEDQPGRAFAAVDLTIEADSVGFDFHGLLPMPVISKNRSRAPQELPATSSA